MDSVFLKSMLDLGLSPFNGVLLFAVWKLWNENKKLEGKLSELKTLLIGCHLTDCPTKRR